MDPDNVYMVPANDESTLYAQYKKMDITHIARDSVRWFGMYGSVASDTISTTQPPFGLPNEWVSFIASCKIEKYGLEGRYLTIDHLLM